MARQRSSYESSFMSERSAELCLVPKLIDLIEDHETVVTPIFYWSTREGGKMSRASFEARKMKVLVFYARRPKVFDVQTGIVWCKINQLLFERSRQYAEFGITTIAGIPLVDTLSGFHRHSPAAWMKIEPSGSELLFQIETMTLKSQPVISFLQPGELRDLVINQSQTYNWNQIIQLFNQIRREPTNIGWTGKFGFGDLYKPIYLLIHR